MTSVSLRRGALALLVLFSSCATLAPAAKLDVIDRIAAVVNDSVIMESELAVRVDEVMRNLRADSGRVPPRDVVQEQVLERMIEERLQLDMAERAGMRIDDTTLNEAIAGIARQNDMSLDQFAAEVRSEGIDWAEFREQIRRELLINQLRQRQVSRRIRITDRELDRFLASELGKKLFENEFRLGHILIALPDGAAPEQVRAAENEADALVERLREGADFRELAIQHSDDGSALDGGDLGWRPAAQLPTLFSQAAVNMQEGDIAGPLRSGAGFHILKMIERKGDDQRFVEQSRVRHVLITSNALRTPEQARDQARELRERVVAGDASFADVARHHSDDPGSGRNGGSLGWVSPGEMVPEFEERMQQTAVGDISPVFETQYGWHFLKVEERRTADMSEEFRRMRARKALHQRRYAEEVEQWLRELRSEAYVDIRI